MSERGTGYLNEVGFYFLSENVSIFTVADHFEYQPMLFISVFLFYMDLTCSFKNHVSNIQGVSFLRDLVGKPHGPQLSPYRPHGTYTPTLVHSGR